MLVLMTLGDVCLYNLGNLCPPQERHYSVSVFGSMLLRGWLFKLPRLI